MVLGANINVLFSPIFECTEAKYKENEYYPDQQYRGAYLFEYFAPEFALKVPSDSEYISKSVVVETYRSLIGDDTKMK